VNLVNAVNALRAKGQILAYHDRSDGGLLAAVAEMAFAGHVGVALNVDMLVTEGDGISDSRMDTGDAKNWAQQVSAPPRRAHAQGAVQRRTGRGAASAHRRAQRRHADPARAWPVQCSHFVGKTRPQSSPIDAGKGELQVWRDAKAVFSAKLEDLHQVWDSVSWKICQQRDNPACADAEHAAAGEPTDPGLHVHLTFDPSDDVAAPYLNLSRPKVAILREQGVNSHVEMAYAFTEAGFEAHDVHMTDLQSGRVQLEDFKGVVACGGFSYGDTLGAGIGWARSITFNPVLAAQFQGFFGRRTPLAWACATAARCLPSWPTSSPARRTGRASPPTRASALRPACRWWKCSNPPACSCKAWRAAACRLPWRTARAMPTSNTVATPTGHRRHALCGQPRPRPPSSTRSTPTAARAA
jgi:phosphoribosylformylglycinamidine synthase